MRWTTQASACLIAAALIGCNKNRQTPAPETGAVSDTAAAGAAPMDTAGGVSGAVDTGTSDTGRMKNSATPSAGEQRGQDTGMSGAATSDTGVTGATGSDTGRKPSEAKSSDSAPADQSQSGVTNSRTDSSTLGPGATKTRPDQGQPVTSKGDTINPGVDSAAR